MNILTQEISNTPSIELVSNECILSAQRAYNRSIRIYQELSNFIWNNSLYSAGEIISGLGANASEVLSVEEKLAESLNGLVSGCVSCNRSLYTKNEDGTVTLN